MAGLVAPCAAKTYGDGSWYCAVCSLRGDADEPVASYCPKEIKKRAPTDAPSEK